MTEFKQYINIFTILEKMLKLSNICVFDRSMNFDLTHELLFSSAPLQGRLLNNFGSCDCFSLTLDEFIALSKTTLSQEFSFDVLSVIDFTIWKLESFLNNLSTLVLLGMQVSSTTCMLSSR